MRTISKVKVIILAAKMVPSNKTGIAAAADVIKLAIENLINTESPTQLPGNNYKLLEMALIFRPEKSPKLAIKKLLAADTIHKLKQA
jgi:hypothetical protein